MIGRMKPTALATMCIIIITALVVIAGCNGTSEPNGAIPNDLESVYASVPTAQIYAPESFPVPDQLSKNYKIGVSMVTYGADFFKQICDEAEAELKKYGVEVLTADAGGDVSEQVSHVENFLAQNVDLIIIDAASPPSGLNLVLEKAFKQGIPIIAMDSHLDEGVKHLAYVGCDNYQLGYRVGMYLGGFLKRKHGSVTGNLAIVEGDPGNIAGKERGDGMLDGLKEVDPNHTVKELARQYGYWAEEEGMEAVENILVANPEIDVIYTYSDNMAVGGVTAATKANRSEMIFASINGSKPALKNMVEGGTIKAVGINDPLLIGRLSAQLALYFLETGQCPSKTILTEPIVATPDNVDALYDPDSPF